MPARLYRLNLRNAVVPMVALAGLLMAQTLPAADPSLPPTVAEGAKLNAVYEQDRFFEGPVWDPKTNKLYFTSFAKGNQQILRLDEPGKATVWMDQTEGVNGTWLSLQGRLLGAQAYGHRVVDLGFGPSGPEDAKNLYVNQRLNQPNDICQTPNGDIYFTDPDFRKRETSAIYRLSPRGVVTKVASDMPLPNGLIASLDGKTLYVGDSHEKLWKSYPIHADGSLGTGKVFLSPDNENDASPDGMSIDAEGNLYFSGRGGVWVANPEGQAIGFIGVPEFCSNVTFGGADGKTLYLTCSKKLYALQMNVPGGQFRQKK